MNWLPEPSVCVGGGNRVAAPVTASQRSGKVTHSVFSSQSVYWSTLHRFPQSQARAMVLEIFKDFKLSEAFHCHHTLFSQFSNVCKVPNMFKPHLYIKWDECKNTLLHNNKSWFLKSLLLLVYRQPEEDKGPLQDSTQSLWVDLKLVSNNNYYHYHHSLLTCFKMKRKKKKSLKFNNAESIYGVTVLHVFRCRKCR